MTKTMYMAGVQQAMYASCCGKFYCIGIANDFKGNGSYGHYIAIAIYFMTLHLICQEVSDS